MNIEKQSSRDFSIKGFKVSILSSILSKSITLLAQVLAVPCIARNLDHDQYTLYALSIAIVGMAGMADIGIGSSIVSSYNRLASEAREGMVATGFALVVLLATIFVIVILVFQAHRFSGEYGRAAFIIALLALYFQIIASYIARINLANGRLYLTNLWASSGGALSLVLVLTSLSRNPTAYWAAASTVGVSTAFLCIAAWQVLRNAGLSVKLRDYYRREYLKPLLKDMLLFSLIALGAYVEREGAKWFVVASSPLQMPGLAILLQISLVLMGPLSMVALPLWPLAINWLSRGRGRDALLLCRVITVGASVYALIVALIWVLYGQAIVLSVSGGNIVIDQKTSAGFAVYQFISLHKHVPYAILISTGRLWLIALSYVVEAAGALLLFSTWPELTASAVFFGLASLNIVSFCLLFLPSLSRGPFIKAGT